MPPGWSLAPAGPLKSVVDERELPPDAAYCVLCCQGRLGRHLGCESVSRHSREVVSISSTLGVRDVSWRDSRTCLEAQVWLAGQHRESYHTAERQILRVVSG